MCPPVFLDHVHGHVSATWFNWAKTFQIQLALKISAVASAARTSVKGISLNLNPPLHSIKSRFNHEWTRINTNSIQQGRLRT
jgi:hypothetical protein